MSKFDIDVDAVAHDDLKAAYRRLLISRNGLKERNGQLAKWATAISTAITHLATEGSLVFQAMAEKAGVRAHPSVSAVVSLFDKIAYPQWHNEDQIFPKIEWPAEWSFECEEQWSGDADMLLNEPLHEAVMWLTERTANLSHADRFKIANLIEKAIAKKIEGVKAAAGFRPRQIAPVTGKPLGLMSKEELIKQFEAMSWLALDLAQDMHFANVVLRRDLRAATYRRVSNDLYRLSSWAFEMDHPTEGGVFGVKVFGREEVPL